MLMGSRGKKELKFEWKEGRLQAGEGEELEEEEEEEEEGRKRLTAGRAAS